MSLHEGKHVVPQHVAVPLGVHGDLGREEEEASSSAHGEPTPHHDTGGVLHRLDGELGLEPVVLPRSNTWAPNGLVGRRSQSPAKNKFKFSSKNKNIF